MTLPTTPTQWRIKSTLCTFVGPITVADYNLDAVTDFRVNLRLSTHPDPPDPAVSTAEWFPHDTQDSDFGLYVGSGGTVATTTQTTYILAVAYLQGDKWFGVDIGVIYSS